MKYSAFSKFWHFALMMQGARPLAKGMKAVGNAVTVRFVPWRPDIAADKPQGEASPEYVFGLEKKLRCFEDI